MARLRRFVIRNPLVLLSGIMLSAWVIIALTISMWAPYDPLHQDIAKRLSGPNWTHLFGTDSLGRDVFSRVLYGARLSLPTAASVVAISIIVGGAYGLISGYIGGKLDEVMMRIADVTLAFPSIILAMAIATALGPSLRNAMLAMIIVWWPEFARLMRGQVLAIRENTHVEAARVMGATSFRIATRHVLPLTVTPMAIKGTLDLGNAIILTAGLSFLGLGATPPDPEWGAMISDARMTFGAWWLGAFPALAIITVVMSANFMGDGLRDYLDPKSRGR
jgi:peptide/nickel transport system permease protein